MNGVKNKEDRIKEDTELIRDLVFNTTESLNKLKVLSEFLLDLQASNTASENGDTIFYTITMIIDYVKQSKSAFEDLSMTIEEQEIV